MEDPTTSDGTLTVQALLSEMAEVARRLQLATRSSDRRVAAAMSSASAAVVSARARLGCDLVFIDSGEANKAMTPTVVEVNGITIDGRRRAVTRDGTHIHLTATMFDVLWFLATDPVRVFSKEEIYRGVWNGGHLVPAGAVRTVESHIGRLRTALGGRPWVHTHWGVGVSLLPPEMSVAA